MAKSRARGPSFPFLPVAAIAAVLYLLWSNQTPDPGPLVPDVKPSVDLVSVFAKNNDRTEASCDAETFGAIVTSVAAVLDYDAKLAEPRVQTGVQIDDLRRWVRDYATGGKSFKEKYPDLGDAVKKFLDAQAGDSGGPLDDAKRAKWISALRALGSSAEYAAKSLR